MFHDWRVILISSAKLSGKGSKYKGDGNQLGLDGYQVRLRLRFRVQILSIHPVNFSIHSAKRSISIMRLIRLSKTGYIVKVVSGCLKQSEVII